MKKVWIFVGIIIFIIGVGIAYKTTREISPAAKPVSVSDISKHADDLPSPIVRRENKKVVVELETKEVIAELAPWVTYEYWTYNGTVPGPFIRVKEGDTVEIRLNHSQGDQDRKSTRLNSSHSSI